MVINNYISLDRYTDNKESVLVGEQNGYLVLLELQKAGYDLSKLENTYAVIIIRIPNNIITINRSYFLGLFKQRIDELGRYGFLNKYKFITTRHIKEKIKRIIFNYPNVII